MHECTNVMDLEDFDTQIKYGHLLLETRECRKCGEVKNLLESFYRQRKDPALKSSYSYECKECTVKRVVENHKKDPSKASRNELRRKYGLTFAEFDKMLTEQNESCAICKSPVAGGKHNRFMVDHDHKTGRVRGLLCKSCNIALGEVNDDLTTLKNMINYLSKHTGSYEPN